MAEPTQDAVIVRVRDVTPRVREMVLLPSAQTISFVPGQWISLKLPVGERPPLNRAYTMAEPETPSGELVLAFDRVHQGRAGQGGQQTAEEQDTSERHSGQPTFGWRDPTGSLLFPLPGGDHTNPTRNGSAIRNGFDHPLCRPFRGRMRSEPSRAGSPRLEQS